MRRRKTASRVEAGNKEESRRRISVPSVGALLSYFGGRKISREGKEGKAGTQS